MATQRWIIISNRLPFSKNPVTGKMEPSTGGLVSAISGIHSDQEKIWVGVAPPEMSESQWKEKTDKQFERYVPVFVNPTTYDLYYNGMANDVIWPLFHYETNYVRFQWDYWGAYKKVNELIANTVAKIATPNDLIWVHDFHLMLVPSFLRKRNKRFKIGFFLHTPFPSSEIFRQLPVRQEILEGLLSSDLIGFHDHSYLRHFGSSLQFILGLDSSLLSVTFKRRNIRLGVFPVSIDTKKFKKRGQSLEVKKIAYKYQREKTYRYLILGVDRLDYSKGIELKLKSFWEMLSRYPDLRHNVSLFQIAVPTRVSVPEYLKLKNDVEQLVGKINGEFGKLNHVPVKYMYSSVSFDELIALYRLADVLTVMSKRDGMNLVALEYIASQDPKDPGVVALSEFTGAISTLSHVVRVNPWDSVETAKQIANALKEPKEDRIAKFKPMLEHLEKYTATDWAETFMTSLGKSNEYSRGDSEVFIYSSAPQSITIPPALKTRIEKKHLLLLLDYDGTLVPIHGSPEEAVLPSSTRESLKSLLANNKIEMVVVSGRDSKFLMKQLKGLNIEMAAEHGAKFFDEKNKQWECLVHTNKQSWYPIALQIMKDYSSRVPGSFVEKKEFALSWHYRKSPSEFASYQGIKLKEELEMGLSNLPVTVLSGKKVIEARAIEANKGSFARWFLDTHNSDKSKFVIAIGDDKTDEDLFHAVPYDSATIKIGGGESRAQYRLASQKDLLPFLTKICQLTKQ